MNAICRGVCVLVEILMVSSIFRIGESVDFPGKNPCWDGGIRLNFEIFFISASLIMKENTL